MVRVYCRCNGGDYFVGEACPFDGWFSPETLAVAEAARRLEQAGITPSIDQLRRAGASDEALARAVIVEFGSEQAAFEALTPLGYLIDGEWRLLRDVPQHLK